MIGRPPLESEHRHFQLNQLTFGEPFGLSM